MTPAPEKAAPIPAEVLALARKIAEGLVLPAFFPEHLVEGIAYGLLADRASQEERIRKDEDGYLVRIAFREGRSGGLRISSPDVPGLILSHHDEPAILADMVAVLREADRARLLGDAS